MNEIQLLATREGIGNLKYYLTPEKVKDAGVVSFGAAEMDFRTAPSIIDSVKRLVENGLFGFTIQTKDYTDHVAWWMREARSWNIEPEWILPTMGTIFSVATAIRLLTKEGEGIIVQPPVYYRYEQAASRLGRKTVYNHLKLENDTYVMDFESLEKCMADPQNKLLVICNPQNPIGRVWSRAELDRIGRLSEKYGVFVFSDEIFAEIVFDDHKTVPYASLAAGREYAITCTSLGKTFNFTGVNHANVIIPDQTLCCRFKEQRDRDHYGSLEPFAYAAICGAYTPEGLAWKENMRQYIEQNRNFIVQYFEEHLQPNKVYCPEGSFVAWIDWRGFDLSGNDLISFLEEEALLVLEPGSDYSKDCGCFTRMNFASSREQLCGAMNRLRVTYHRYKEMYLKKK